ncbi:hypothetical protein [Chitinophaga sancti]|uniref:Uncharacterized protein n=1 Tax=Chitinophaga sancti TaxID=1004 RepID=A0A1K1LUF2_9BACT|nr:hypothetical protein [Chitinophaga sancti]WQD64845.1 hypothetical protein U0033_10600 [Chitinophaga sancti]WQG89531.1 hypothetical protein SR876_31870 [Chitinophaga sancti]SFW14483.1 hypothetical protein SAMN05661012_00220 [Chitinophaga sancti]
MFDKQKPFGVTEGLFAFGKVNTVSLISRPQGFNPIYRKMQHEPPSTFYPPIDKSNVDLFLPCGILRANKVFMAIAAEKKSWVKWIRRVGIWGFLFFLAKGLLWLVLAYWIVK